MHLVYLISAIVGGALLLLQIVLSLFGADHDVDAGHLDVGHLEVEHDGSGGAGGLSFRAVVAFLAFFGITGLACLHAGLTGGVTLLIAFAAGSLSFWLTGLALVQFARLRSSGTVDVKNAVGVEGKVYLTIPSAKSGEGAVTIPIQGRTMQYRAITSGSELKTGALCRVRAVHAQDTLEVEAL